MIKSDYGHVFCPFYEQKFDNGLKLIFIPSKNQVRGAGVYIAQGGFKRDLQIDKSKIPFGTPYVLEKVLARDEVKDNFLKKGVVLKSHTDFSYTIFSVYTLGDVFEPFRELLKSLVPSSFSEEDIEKVKKTIKADPLTDLTYSAKKTVDNLFFSSPIKYGIIPSEADLTSIHYSALKKYLQKYYTPANITLFIIGDYTNDAVLKGVESLKLLGNTYPDSKEGKYEENYTAVKESYEEEEREDIDASILTLGVKFFSREQIYQKYGQLMFYVYEVFMDIYFRKNPEFLKNLEEFSCELINCEFKQGGEDSYLLLQFRSEKGVALKTYLTNYFTHLNKKLSHSVFSSIIENYYAKSLGTLVSPSDLFFNFASAYANNMPYTGLIAATSKMNYKSFKNFTADFMTFPRSIFYLKKK